MKKQMKSSIIATFCGGEFNLKIVARTESIQIVLLYSCACTVAL